MMMMMMIIATMHSLPTTRISARWGSVDESGRSEHGARRSRDGAAAGRRRALRSGTGRVCQEQRERAARAVSPRLILSRQSGSVVAFALLLLHDAATSVGDESYLN